MKSIFLWGFSVASVACGIVFIDQARADQRATARIVLSEPAGLDKTVSLTFKRTPIQDALREIAELADLKLEIDGDALKQKGLTKNMPVTLDIKDTKLSVALRKVLDSAAQDQLDYELRDEGKTLFVSSKEALKKPE